MRAQGTVRRRGVGVGVVVLAAALGLGACGRASGPEYDLDLPWPDLTPGQIPAIYASAAPESYLLITSNASTIEVYDGPSGALAQTVDAAAVLTVPDQTPLTFLGKSEDGEWIEVYLPVRPNGSTGWVRRADVEVTGTHYSIEVYLAEHVVVLFDEGVEQVRYSAALGTDERPTPDGVYFIRELLQPPNPNGDYGVFAYGLSGFSPTLETFNGGDAVIGLHGTNRPELLGTDVSHGCIRISNESISSLVWDYGLPLGTPVFVYADEATATFARAQR